MAAYDTANNNYYYSFDDLNRLLQFCTPNCSGTTGAYGYDRNGNRWSGGSPDLSFTGGNNRMDGYGYDAAGNLLADGNHSYTYDDENRIIAVDGGTTAGYIYDVFGRRAQAVVDGVMSEYLYDPSGHEIVINAGQAPTQEEVAFAGRSLATLTASGTFYTHADPLGTVRVRSNAGGTSVETDISGPFGEPQYIGNAISLLHFTGKYDDPESGLDYFGARYYSPALGRFMTPDWSDASDPIPYADLSNPQSLNLYAYAGNNPVTNTDPDGHLLASGLGSMLLQDEQQDEADYVNNTVAPSIVALQQSAQQAQTTPSNAKTSSDPIANALGELPGVTNVTSAGTPYAHGGHKNEIESLGFSSPDAEANLLATSSREFLIPGDVSENGFGPGIRLPGGLHVENGYIDAVTGNLVVTAHIDLFNANDGLAPLIGHFVVDVFVGTTFFGHSAGLDH